MKLHSMNMNGNLHMLTRYVNEHLSEVVPGIVHMESDGHNSIMVFRAPEAVIQRLKEEKKI